MKYNFFGTFKLFKPAFKEINTEEAAAIKEQTDNVFIGLNVLMDQTEKRLEEFLKKKYIFESLDDELLGKMKCDLELILQKTPFTATVWEINKFPYIKVAVLHKPNFHGNH